MAPSAPDGAGNIGRVGARDVNTFTNYGTIEAVNGGSVVLGDNFVNAGTLHVGAGSTLTIDGDTIFAAGSQLTGSGGALVVQSDRLDLFGSALDIDQFASINHTGGTLANGTITASLGSVFRPDAVSSNRAAFEAMAFDTDVQLDDNEYNVHGGLTLLNNAEILTTPSNDTLEILFSEGQTIGGTGRLTFGLHFNDNALNIYSENGAPVIFDTGIFIDALSGGGTIGGFSSFGDNNATWINRGTIAVGSGQEVELLGAWSNEGTIVIENNATIALGGTFTTDDLGTVLNQGGDIFITGELDNTGEVFDLLFLPGAVTLRHGSTVRGGTIQSSGTSTIALQTNGTVTLDRVTLDVTPESVGQINIIESLTVNEGLGIGRGDQLFAIDDSGDDIAHLLGNGTIRTIDEGGANGLTDISPFNNSDTTLLIGPGITVIHEEPTVELYIGRFGDVVNQGTLDLRRGYTEFRNNWSNQGSIIIGGTAEVFFRGAYTTADLQSITYINGDVIVGGTIDNTGAVLRKDATTAWIQVDEINGLYINGGRVETGDSRTLRYVRGLDAVTLAGDLWLDDGNVDITNGLVFDGGTLHILDEDNQLASGELTGTGTIRFDVGRYSAPILGFDHSITLAAGLTVQTGASGGTIGRAGVVWTNDAALQSLNNGLDLRIAGDVSHNGTARAANGGTLTFENLNNHGTLLAEDGGTLRLEAGWVNPDGAITAQNAGVIALESWSPTPGTFALNNGVVRVEFDTDLAQLGTLPQASGSTIEIANELDLGGGTLDLDALTSMFRLNGGTLRDGSVVGSSPLLLLNTTLADVNVLDGVDVFTDVILADDGTTQLRNATAFHGGTITGDGTLLVATLQTASFDAATIESDVVVNGGATMAVTNGLTLDGVIASGVGAPRPQVRFNGTQAVTGTGSFQSATPAGLNLRHTGDLTLGADIQLQAVQGVLSFNGVGQTLTIDGRLDVAGVSRANINADTVVNNGTLALNLGGEIDITANTVSNHGTIDLNNGLIRATDTDIDNTLGSLVLARGTADLGGDGTFRIAGDVQNPTTPGSRLVVLGHVALENTAQTTLTVFDGRSESLAFLHATGDVTLDGELVLDSETLTEVAAGQVQALILAEGALSGAFDSVLGLQIDPIHSWHLSYVDDSLVAEVRVAGDATGDGFVGAADLDLILANWGDAVVAGDAAAGDWTGDGAVGQQDLQVVLDHWGQSAAAPEGGDVPEPGTLAMLALIGMGLTRRRRNAC
ncbi:PEP-CTERM sorting domain-containing protein [Phycisphaeraceae bacterium D3-23]